VVIEHWIHDTQNNNILSSIQIPIVKKYTGCEISMMDIKNKRKSVVALFI
jgi:hypothetical protein